jgi:hypothetical protein
MSDTEEQRTDEENRRSFRGHFRDPEVQAAALASHECGPGRVVLESEPRCTLFDNARRTAQGRYLDWKRQHNAWIERQEERAASALAMSRVYFVRQSIDGPIKIGFSTDIRQRLRALSIVSPGGALEVLLVIRGTLRDEHELHLRHAVDRLHGEWFRPSEAVLATIRELAPKAIDQEAVAP